VQTIQQCLDAAGRDFNIDTSRIALSGFSDGASYALSLGLTNGDVFTHIIALSPGYFFTKHPIGRPSIYVCHGVNDNVLAIDRCSRRIVPQLLSSGYPVEYREFGGGHLIRPDVLRASLLWFLGKNRVARHA
jgi:predicted esterase